MEDKVHWIEVSMACDGELAEALADVLGRFASNGVVVEAVTRFNPHTQENEPTGMLNVSGYLPVDAQLETTRQKLAEALWHLGQIAPVPEPQYRPIKEENWMEAWKAHYRPVPLGQHLLVMPAWMQPEGDETRAVIRINPAMAFGTGTHPTTQLCLRLLEQHIRPGINVIDVGCGSGILSVAALKLGAAQVLAVDTDRAAVASTLENASLNAIATGELQVGQGSVRDIVAGQFDIQEAPLVLVNILATIILKLFDQGLAKLVAPGGTLLLSGILAPQEADLLSTAQGAGLTLAERLSDGDWVALALRNKR